MQVYVHPEMPGGPESLFVWGVLEDEIGSTPMVMDCIIVTAANRYRRREGLPIPAISKRSMEYALHIEPRRT